MSPQKMLLVSLREEIYWNEPNFILFSGCPFSYSHKIFKKEHFDFSRLLFSSLCSMFPSTEICLKFGGWKVSVENKFSVVGHQWCCTGRRTCQMVVEQRRRRIAQTANAAIIAFNYARVISGLAWLLSSDSQRYAQWMPTSSL